MGWDNRSAFVFIKSQKNRAEDVFDMLKDKDYTIGVFQTTGQYDVIAWIATSAIKDTCRIVSEIRYWSGVEKTSAQLACYRSSNERVSLLKPGFVWIATRGADYHTVCARLNRFNNLAMAVSTTGDFNCIAMFHGDQLEEAHTSIYSLKQEGCEVEYYPALRYFWNTERAYKRSGKTETKYQAHS